MSEIPSKPSNQLWAIVPAAGSGRRMGSEIPKQYLMLDEYSVLEHGLHRLSRLPGLTAILVVLAQDDSYWTRQHLSTLLTPVETVIGGIERCDSVLNGLRALQGRADKDDWVLIHDAARPCIRLGDILTLIGECRTDAVGGLLAIPVHDTMKQASGADRVDKTIDREHLWRALTPQMFRYGLLVAALEDARDKGITVTDEAMAVELQGKHPKLVKGHGDNIKITRPEDLSLAAFYLREQAHDNTGPYNDETQGGVS